MDQGRGRRLLERGWRQIRWRIAAAQRRFPGELGQIRIRLFYAVGIWAYVLAALVLFGEALPGLSSPIRIVAAGTVIALALPVHLLATLRRSHMRRVIGMIHDIGALSLFMHFGGAVTAPFFPVYLWIVLGNGFRFGVAYLLTSGALSVLCFGIVIASTPIWREQLLLSSGLLGSLVVIPTYVASLIAQLHRSRAEAERASAAKSDFLATVSHEVRTPLNAIIGLSDILRAAPLEGEQRQMVRSIGTAGRALLELMSDILNLARIDAGREECVDEPVSLYHLLAELEAIIAPLAREKGLSLALQVALDVPPRVLVDRRHLQKVLINLLVNAVKFSDDGTIRLRLARAPRPPGDMLCLTVADDGRGIAEEEQERIFESFTQSRRNRRDSEGGAGLGLAIVKRLVELMGGEVGLESRIGEGATFTVSLPLRQATGDEAPVPALTVPVFSLAASASALRKLFGAKCPSIIKAATLDALIDRVAEWGCESGERPVLFLDEAISAPPERLAALTLRLEALGLFAAPLVVVLHRGGADAAPPALPPQALSAIAVDAGEQEKERLLALIAILLDHQSGTAEQVAAAQAESGGGLRILVAEDNRVNRQIAERILERLGHRVESVDNGEAALEALDATRYDAVFMDVNMPVLSGLEATQMIRAMEGGDHHTPIIGLTADATADAKRQCEEAGMDAVTFKPVSPPAIRAVLARLVPAGGRRRGSIAAAANVVSHPQLQTPRERVIDADKLAELEALCSEAMLKRLKTEFVEDAESLQREIRETVVAGDLRGFRDTAHAIRSMAANMGALRLLALCNRCRSYGHDTLRTEGEAFLVELEREVTLLRATLLEQSQLAEVRRSIKDRR